MRGYILRNAKTVYPVLLSTLELLNAFNDLIILVSVAIFKSVEYPAVSGKCLWVFGWLNIFPKASELCNVFHLPLLWTSVDEFRLLEVIQCNTLCLDLSKNSTSHSLCVFSSVTRQNFGATFLTKQHCPHMWAPGSLLVWTPTHCSCCMNILPHDCLPGKIRELKEVVHHHLANHIMAGEAIKVVDAEV